MPPATVHRIHETPPAVAFAHARLADTLAPQPPASREIGDTVARWREREADTEVLDLTHFPIVERDDRRFHLVCIWVALAIFAWLGAGLFAAHLAGRF